MNKWDKNYLKLAEHISGWSKDPSTKVGCVVVSNSGQILATGYNGFPRGVEDSEERLNERKMKYQMVVHAEMNAIYNATYHGISLRGSKMYVWGLSCCSECAKGIIQAGVHRVIAVSTKEASRWAAANNLAIQMLEEGNVYYEIWDKDFNCRTRVCGEGS